MLLYPYFFYLSTLILTGIKKEIIKDGEEYIVGLDNEEEYYKAIELFEKKYQ